MLLEGFSDHFILIPLFMSLTPQLGTVLFLHFVYVIFMALASLKCITRLHSYTKNLSNLSAINNIYHCQEGDIFRDKYSDFCNIHRNFYSKACRASRNKNRLAVVKESINSQRAVRQYCSKTENYLLSSCPTIFVDFLKSKKINRCFFVWSESENKVVASHPELKEIEDWLNDSKNPHYLQHEAIFLAVGMRTNCLLGAFLWKVDRGQACGGIRMTPFTSVEHYLGEGLRLSRRLGVKSALAGLWVSGGKGLILEPKDRQHIQPEFRQKIFYDYGDFLSSLNGCYIAGMDTGVNAFDLFNIHTHTRWVVSGPEDIGGSGNAAAILGKGLLCAMEAALNFLGAGDLSGMKVAIQGAGGIGLAVASGLLDRHAAHVYVTDTSKKSIGDLHDALASKARGRLKVEKVSIGDNAIVGYDCDIFAPCAVGHVLTPETILNIKAKIVCGSANALLASENDTSLLVERDVTYVPEFIPNRMAFVNAANENYGRIYRDPAIERHFDKNWEHSIYYLTQETLKRASEKNITVIEAAYQMADVYIQQKHPLWPDRTKNIIKSLVEGQWHHGQDFWRKRRNFAKSDCT
ncbi:leucine dehydrogenase [Trichonephila clavata]|uniref:Leucine dehydrogenase n=1 Tax=Trichonephila clavata TaxID=2740835 RepID=A0A8X6GVT5_TRICU|nr:leucine dehydrogenase [Trichonephila clavata]